MVLTFVGATFFGILNLMRGIHTVAWIEFAFAVYCIAATPLVRKTRRLRRWALAIALPWMLAVLAVVSLPEATNSVFIWPLVLPILLMFLLGRRIGLALSLLCLISALLIAMHRFGLPQNPDQIAFMANLVLAATGIVVLSYVYERSRERAEAGLHELAVTDTLTGLANRSLLYTNFAHLKALALRQNHALSLILLDLDHFKQINDRHGHDAGDRALKEVAALLRNRLRRSDQIYRIGGEEILVVMPDTNLGQAARVAESIRALIEGLELVNNDQPVKLTASLGVAEMNGADESFEELLRRGDQNMYWCKEHGRNLVRAA